MSDILSRFRADERPWVRAVQNMDSTLARFEGNSARHFRQVDARFDALARAAKYTGAAVVSALSVNIGTSMSDEAKRIRNALIEMGREGQESFDLLYQKSTESLTGLSEFAVATQRMHKVLADRQSFEQTVQQVTTLNKLLALSSATAQERASVLLQFSQALRSDRLGGEELRALLENAPTDFINAIARAAGGTAKELKDMAAAGTLNTDVMIAALQSLEKEAARRFAAVNVTWAEAVQEIRKGVLLQVEAFDQSTGASNAAVQGALALGRALGENREAAAQLAEALKVGAAALAALYGTRKIGEMVQAIRALNAARQEEARGLLKERAALSERLRDLSQERAALVTNVTERKNAVIALEAEGASKKKITRANRELITAQNRLDKATRALDRANKGAIANTTALSAAQAQLSRSTRLTTSALAGLRGAYAFMGGLPGLILTAASALAVWYSTTENAKTAAEKLNDSVARFSDAKTAYSDASKDMAAATTSITQAEEALARAISANDTAAQARHRANIAASEVELARLGELRAANLAVMELELARQKEALNAQNQARIAPFILKYTPRETFSPRDGARANQDYIADRDARQAAAERDYQAQIAAAEKRLTARKWESDAQRDADENLLRQSAQYLEARQALDDRQAELTRQRSAMKIEAADATSAAEKRAADAQNALQQEALASYARASAELSKLQEQREAVLAGIAEGGDTSRLKEALANIDQAISRLKLPIEGSLASVQDLRAALGAVIAQMGSVDFDKNQSARSAAMALRARIDEVIAAGHDLDRASLASLAREFDQVTAAAHTLSDAIAASLKSADQMITRANEALERKKLEAIKDRAARSGALAKFDFEKNNPLPSGADDLETRGWEMARERYIQIQTEIDQLSSQGTSRRVGGRRRESAAQKELNEATRIARDLHREMMSDDEKHLARLAELTEARAVLVAKYGEEHELVKKLDEDRARFENRSIQGWAKIAQSMSAAIVQGKNFGDVLKHLLLQMIQMNGAKAFSGLFSGGGLGDFFGDLFGLGSAASAPSQGFARGGYVSGPGGPTSDAIPARLSNGEFVVNAAATQKNLSLLQQINSGLGPSLPDLARLDQLRPASVVNAMLQTNIDITLTGTSVEDVMQRLVPVLNRRDNVLVSRIGARAHDDPRFLGA